MNSFKFLFLLVLLSVFQSGLSQSKAIFIILDGIPADVIEKTETPVLDEIAALGGYTRSFTGGIKNSFSQSPTISAVGYNHLLTATWTNKHNVWDNAIKEPNYNYWNIFRIVKTVKPEAKTAIFSTWTDNRTKLIGEGLPLAGNIKSDYSFDGFELDTLRFPHDKGSKYISDIDELVSTEAARYITEKAPDLSWVYLEYTDDMGHRFGDSPEFYDAVKKADAQVGKIWKAIKQRESSGEKWMIVITTDHGRDSETGKKHGGQSERERSTWIVTNNTSLNQRFKQTPAVVDIAPSILRHLNVGVPEKVAFEMDGVPFTGKISISNLQATKEGNKINLKWAVIDPAGDVQILLAASNSFKEGKEDSYLHIGNAAVLKGTYSFDAKQYASHFYKIVVKAPGNILNTWIIDP